MGNLNSKLKNKLATVPTAPVSGINKRLQNKLKDPSSSFSYNNKFEAFDQRDIYGVDLTNRDYLTGFENPLKQDINELRANRQPWLTKAATGVARIGAKVVTEVAKMPGVIGGSIAAIAAPEGQGWETAFNNSWIKTVEELGQDFNTEVLPVYVKKAISEGNLWENITSMDFWATEGADGIGFIASMMVPGVGLKALGIGDKLAKGLRGATKALGKGDKLDDIAKMLGKIGATPKNAELATQTVANTLIEAAAESKSAGDRYMMDIAAKLESGEISEEDAKLAKAEVMRNVFTANALILLGPNAVMTKMLWGAGAKAGSKIMSKGNIVNSITKPGFKKGAKKVLGDIGKAGAREGLWEEGMQSTAESYFTERGGNSGNIFEAQAEFGANLVNSYTDMLGSVEGQKAMFLGAFLGGGMQAYFGSKSRKRDRNIKNSLIPQLKNIDSFYKLFTDEIYNEDGTIDNIKVQERLQTLHNSDKLSELFNIATEKGDNKTLEELRAYATGEMIKSFITNEEVGMEAFDEYIENTSTFEGISTKEKKDIKKIVDPIKVRAKKLQQDYNTFKEFAPTFLDIKSEHATEKDKASYYDILSSQYITKRNFQYFVDAQLDSKLDLKANFLKSIGEKVDLEKGTPEFNKLYNEDIAFKSLIDEVNSLEENKKSLAQDINDFWKSSQYTEGLEQFSNMRVEMEKAQAKEEETTNIIKAINKAKTVEEVEKVSKTSTISDAAIDVAKKNKIADIKSQAKTVKKEIIKTQKSKSEVKTTEGAANIENTNKEINDVMSDINSASDMITITGALLEASDKKTQSELIGTDAIVQSKDSNSMVLVSMATGEEITVTKKEDIKPPTESVDDYSTEGSDRHDELSEKVSKSVTNKTTSTSAGTLLMGAKNTGEKLGFVSDAYMEFERNPIDKRGKDVHFEIDTRSESTAVKITNKTTLEIFKKLQKNPSLTKLTKAQLQFIQSNYKETNILKQNLFSLALRSYKSKGVTTDNINFLIYYLPIGTKVSDNVGTPIMTNPLNVKNIVENEGKIIIEAEENFSKSTKNLRVSILNNILLGVDLKDITAKIEGQYGGTITTEANVIGFAKENNVLDLHTMLGKTTKEKLEYIQNNIGFINSNGLVELSSGDTFALNVLKEKAKGEIYILIPSANGTRTPLKLNIQRLENEHKLDILADLVELRFGEDVNKSTTMLSLKDQPIYKSVKSGFTEELKFIGKTFNDTTIKDIVDFMVFDKTDNIKTRVKFSGAGKVGYTKFTYGNPKTDGAMILTTQKLDKPHFKEWLSNNKRHNITMKQRPNNNVSVFTNTDYLKYLLENKIINTNAVTGIDSKGVPIPTFQGRTSMYLKSDSVRAPKPSPTNKPEIKTAVVPVTVPDIDGIGGAMDVTDVEKMIADAITESQDTSKGSTNNKENKNKPEIIRNSQKKVVPLHEVSNTEESKEVKKEIKANTKTDVVAVSDEMLKNIIKQLMIKKLLKGGSVLARTISNKALSNQEKLDKMQEVLGKSTTQEIIKNCK